MKQRVGWATMVLVGSVLVLGCEGGGDAVQTGPAVAVEEPPVTILPKWKLPGDYRIPGKADNYDDYRAANPKWYALTVPPAKTGFRAATEWQDMMGVLLGYPGSQGTAVNNSMAQMVVKGHPYVDWYIVVPSASAQTSFVNLLKSNGMSQAQIDAKVHFLQFNLDSIWMIDYGPFPLVAPDGSVAFSDFRYYHQRVYDDAIPTKVGNALGVTTYRAGMDYEGGNFQMDEAGTCYLSQGAFWENPDKTEAQVKEILTQYLGCKTFIVLAPLQDGTTHIDMFSKLASKNVFVLGRATSATATTTTINTLEQDNSILTAAVLADGSKLTVHRIPMPYQKDGVWRTYTNSTLANGVNLWPIYDRDKDLEAQALVVWQTAMPNWDHLGIDSSTIITWGGAMHCISRALPTGTYTKWVADGTCSGGACEAPQGGYDGTCTNSADCTGPEWLCALPDCGSVPQDCGGITYEGCCDGEVLKWCENGLQTMNCSGSPKCGWNSTQGFYDCGTNGGSDPSGQFPKACPGTCTPNCTGKVCGDDGCGGSCGTCRAGQACQAGQCVACTPNCTGKQCGDDGCGGSCGTCPTGQTCQAGQCVQGGNEYPYQCLGLDQPSASTCTVIDSYEGCCDAQGRVVWCEKGKLYCIDCANLAPQCGWDSQGFYNCQTNGGSDPSGQFPKACPGACTPNCTGKVCGDDGCGGSCGTCGAGQACQAGQCVACTPNCTGKQCGDDGCGGSCGTCGAGQTCQAGQCVQQTDPCKGITIEGCCDGNVNWWCENNQLFSEDCSKTNPPSQCGWLVPGGQYVSGYYCGGSGADPSGQFPKDCPAACTPNCTGKQCGDDGCGGSCGTCGAGQTCQAGQCVSCTPNCTGKQCGDDGCGGSCGTCAGGLFCQGGQCVGCIPNCDGKECGNDGCGGSCGTCGSGETCQGGQCVIPGPDVTPDGMAPDSAIPDSFKPDAACIPDCTGRQCGPDGCGGSCGTCPSGFACSAQGQCLAIPADSGQPGDAAGLDAAPGTDAGLADTGGGGKKSGSGCAASSRNSPDFLVLLGLTAFAVLARSRRRTTTD